MSGSFGHSGGLSGDGFRGRGGSRGHSGRGSRGGPRGGGRGGALRSASWQRGGDAPRERPATMRLAGARADLERALRELAEATKDAASAAARVPDSSVLEHTKELDLDAILAPWRRVRTALNDLERSRQKIDWLKFPKAGAPSQGKPRRDGPPSQPPGR